MLTRSSGAMAAMVAIVVALSGCGGGSSSSSTPTVSGTAATGAAMTGTAYLKDAANDPEMNTAIAANTGNFSFNVSGKTAPYMLRAGTMYSMTGGPGTANINPATTLIVAEMGGFTNMSSLNGFYRNPNATKMNSMMANATTAKQQFQQKMAPLLNQYGASGTDPMNGSFTVGQGMDKMFDDVKMSIDANGTVTMVYPNGTPVFTGPMGNMAGGTMMTGNIVTPGTGATAASGITVTPSTARLQVNGTQQFSANIPVTWSVIGTNSGTITTAGLYSAPATQGMYVVKATSIADPTKSATVMIQVGSMGMTTM
jgi:hypothetical protein